MRKVNIKKLRDEIAMVGVIILGIALLVCNFFKIVPSTDTPLGLGITAVISIGFPIGLILIVFGIVEFFRVRNTRYTRKKGTRK